MSCGWCHYSSPATGSVLPNLSSRRVSWQLLKVWTRGYLLQSLCFGLSTGWSWVTNFTIDCLTHGLLSIPLDNSPSLLGVRLLFTISQKKSQFLIKFLRKPRHQCHTPRLVLLSGRCERSRPSRWICRNGWRTWVSHTGFAVKSSAASSTRRNTCRTRAGSGLAVNIYPVPETKNRSTSVTTLYRHDILEQHTPNS